MQNGETTFTVKVTMKARWIPHFLAMLKQMQRLGEIGSSRGVHFFADGDGDFRPSFSWDITSDLATPKHETNGETYYDAG